MHYSTSTRIIILNKVYIPSIEGIYFYRYIYIYNYLVSFVTAVQQLLQAGGYKELWRGLGARTMSLAGTFTVVPIVMALLKPKKNMD